MSLKFNGPQVSQEILGRAVRGLNLGAERLRSVAVARTPLDQGYLRNSLTVVPATVAQPRAAVVSNLAYAVRQHENMNYSHRDGRAKFLESAANDEERNIRSIIAQSVKGGL